MRKPIRSLFAALAVCILFTGCTQVGDNGSPALDGIRPAPGTKGNNLHERSELYAGSGYSYPEEPFE